MIRSKHFRTSVLTALPSLLFGLWGSSAAAEEPVVVAPPAVTEPSRAVTPAPAQQPDARRPSSEPSGERSGRRPTLALSDFEAVSRALAQNPTLRAAELDLETAGERIRAEGGRYPYSFVADAGATNNQSTQLRVDDSVAPGVVRTVDAGVGMRRTFSFGAVAEVRASHQYFNRNINAVMSNPFMPANEGHISSLRASVSQPLLRGFGTGVGESELRIARASRAATEDTLTRVRSSLVHDVLMAYYELWYAEKALEIEHASLALAREQEHQAEERVASGAVPAAELFTFQTRTSEHEESVVNAELGIEQRSMELAQLIGQFDSERTHFSVTTDPDPGSATLAAATVERAMASSSVELAELEQQVRVAQTRAEAAGDATRPRLDADAYIQSNGVSTEFPRAWERAGSFEWWSAHVGLTLELPLDQSRHDSELSQARLAVAKARATLRAAQDRVAHEASYAAASDRAARERQSSAERTQAIAERAYEAASARFELGQTIAITLQQAEDDLRRAKLRVIRARVDSMEQSLDVDHLSGKLLARYRAPR